MAGCSRRTLLIGTAACLAVPVRLAAAPSLAADHAPRIDVPRLSEDPTAVPVEVAVEHPMEPDHYIRAIDVTLENDPVPHKGTFLFSPANGRALVAFQMRSGIGGVLTATVECTRHGRFVGTREIKVAEGGCTTAPDATARSGGNPRIRLPHGIRAGEIIQVRTKIDHNSYTGLVLKEGRFVRAMEEFYVAQMLVYLGDQQVSEFRMTSAVSANPLIRFPLRATRSGTLRVVFVNSEGRRWEVSQPLRI